MSWLSQIQEVLRILTPIRIISPIVIFSLSSCIIITPWSLLWYLQSLSHFHDLNRLTGKHSQKEITFIILLVFWNYHIGDHHVNACIFTLEFLQSKLLSYFSLCWYLSLWISLHHYITLHRSLPYPISASPVRYNHEVALNVGLFR